MPYYRCPECAFTVQSVAGRFAVRACPHCSVPLEGTEQIYAPERSPSAISRRFPAERATAAAARELLETLVWELDPAQLQIAALLTTELIANSVEHSGTDATGTVRLDATLTENLLRVEVGDDGSGFVPTPRAPDAPLDCRWGLHLVDQLSDRWGVASELGTLVWFELDRAALTTSMPPPRRELAAG
jgi:anti-sigma regulatory factor (Ser/Thr protein kinase)